MLISYMSSFFKRVQMKLEKFINEITSLGFSTKPILDFIRILYIAGELRCGREIKISRLASTPE